MKTFTPPDLRRTAATMVGFVGQKADYLIAHCLDHRKERGDDEAPAVTSGVYVRHQHLPEKHEVLTTWENILLSFISDDEEHAEPGIALAA